MNKMIALLIAAAFALTGCTAPAAPAPTAEPTEDNQAVDSLVEEMGTVTEITDSYVTFVTADGLYIQANLTGDTLVEYDVPGSDSLALGDYIHVFHSGMMTRSIPAQITALTIRCAARAGVITQLGENSFTLSTGTEEIVVNALPEQMEGLAQDMQVTVYFSGAMTMSLPAQIGAEHIVAAE